MKLTYQGKPITIAAHAIKMFLPGVGTTIYFIDYTNKNVADKIIVDEPYEEVEQQYYRELARIEPVSLYGSDTFTMPEKPVT